jgi:primosomal protein N' (replication factor Y)
MAVCDAFIGKGLFEVVEDWSAVNVEVELFSLNLPFDVALSKLKKTKSYAERVRLLSYLRERLYATREELKEEGFFFQRPGVFGLQGYSQSGKGADAELCL